MLCLFLSVPLPVLALAPPRLRSEARKVADARLVGHELLEFNKRVKRATSLRDLTNYLQRGDGLE